MRSTTVKIRYYETDMMGIMHHTNHLRLFELGRVEYLREAGIDLLGEHFNRLPVDLPEPSPQPDPGVA